MTTTAADTGSPAAAGEAFGPALVGSRCRECETRMFPAQPVCPVCMSEDLAEEAMPRRGVVYSSARVHVGPAKWRKPFVIGYVDLPNGVRVFTHFAGEVSIGAAVEAGTGVVGEDADGRPIESFVFAPVEG